ncbi:MAG: phosphate signaling complex protein PhoU [Eubacteriales bacterium]|nr:phosphate signaling complex protein PhoU [Eubacteriales bacterium]
MRRYFDEQIAHLNEQMIAMGGMVESIIETACAALENNDLRKAAAIRDGDGAVDHKEREVESLCLHMLLQQQPVARDLRVISAALKMITDMERIGDQAADISEIVTMAHLTHDRPGHFTTMARAAIDMVHRAIEAYVRQDVMLARQVMASDDIVDDLFNDVKADVAELLHKDPSGIEEALDLLMIAKYLERIGDHAVNIAEWVVYAITGLYKGEVLR